MRHLICILTAILLQACTVIDDKVTVVDNFDVEKYMGTWHEIARLDHSFERGMDNVTANYQLEGDKVIVTNRGYDNFSKQWDEALGKAYFIEGKNKGLLKVSFFGPFYGAYQIHDLVIQEDGSYSDSLVIGPNNTYAWILSRNKTLSEEVQQRFLQKLEKLDINKTDIIWVKQAK